MSDPTHDHEDPFDGFAQDPDVRRRKLLVAGVLGGIAVVGVLVAVVLSVTLSGGSDGPDSPTSAAAQWARAVVGHDSGKQDALQCVGNHSSADVVRLLVPNAAPVQAGTAVPDGAHHWQVPVTIGGSTVTVGVQEQNGRYLVC